MKNVICLFLLLVLSLQTAELSWAIPGGIPEVASAAPQSFPKSKINPLSISKITAIDSMVHEADSMETPCDVTENETWDTASDEGLQENLHFNLTVERSKTLLPRLEKWYNFFIRYGIPPPEFL